MTQGKKINIVFPIELYDFIRGITEKLKVTPMRDPKNPQNSLLDEKGNIVYMSKSGKVEEFIHASIIQAVISLAMSNPSFLPNPATPPQVQIVGFLDQYGKYIDTYFAKGP